MKELMLGNKAVARGLYEAGVAVASSYPGTPSTETTEEASKFEEIYCEWAPNEKVAMEVASGASISGVRAMASMKHVGVNVAADPLYSISYIGSNGGLVIVAPSQMAIVATRSSALPTRLSLMLLLARTKSSVWIGTSVTAPRFITVLCKRNISTRLRDGMK